MNKQSIILSIQSDANGRLFHLHDLNSQVTITYIDDAENGVINFIDDLGKLETITHEIAILEEYSLFKYEINPAPDGETLKIFCKDNFGNNYIQYFILNVDSKYLQYTDIQTNLTHINTDGN